MDNRHRQEDDMTKKILIAGESWMSYTTHVKGFDSFTTSVYEEGVDGLRDALLSGGYEVEFIPNHLASEKFPLTAEGLQKYSCIILSDIGSNTLLLSNNVFAGGNRESNRLELVRDYVIRGGAFMMVGGYMSFTGIDAKSRYGDTAIADILPVTMLDKDDRVESPQGAYPEILNKDHPVFEGIDGDWPHFLGYNRTIFKSDSADLLASIGEDPFIALAEYGKGRSGVFTSDCAPHWGPREFMEWKYYQRLWCNLMDWLTAGSGR
jgi:uncharacterized membrane protein